jgi:DNA invertase Pin-like site-specific DNA recombinase
MNASRNAVIYCRVSTGNQQNNPRSVSSDVQERVCRDFIVDNNLKLTAIYKETTSAYKGKRKLLDNIIRVYKNVTIVCYDVSRFTRNIAMGQAFIAKASRKGIRFAFASDGLISNDTGSNILTLMQQAQAESENLGRRIRDAFRLKREQGYYTGGATPYGFSRNVTQQGTLLVPNAVETPVVNLIMYCKNDRVQARRVNNLVQALVNENVAQNPVELTVNGRNVATLRRPLTSREIANILNDYNIAARVGRWTPAKITSIVSRNAGDMLANLFAGANLNDNDGVQAMDVDSDEEIPARPRRITRRTRNRPIIISSDSEVYSSDDSSY